MNEKESKTLSGLHGQAHDLIERELAWRVEPFDLVARNEGEGGTVSFWTVGLDQQSLVMLKIDQERLITLTCFPGCEPIEHFGSIASMAFYLEAKHGQK